MSLAGRLGGGSRLRFAAHATVAQVVFAAVAFIGSVLTARILGTMGKGEYTAWTLATVTVAIPVSGTVSVGLARAYLQGARDELLWIAWRRAAATAVVMAAASGLLIAVGLDAIAVVSCVIIAIPFWVLSLNAQNVMVAAKRPWAMQSIRALGALTYVSGFAVLAAVGPDDALDLTLVLWAAGAAVSALVSVILLRRLGGSERAVGTPPDTSPRAINALGAGGSSSQLIDWLLFRVDLVLVFVLVGPAALGIYSVAVNWSEIATYVGHSIGGALFEDRSTMNHAVARRVLRRALPVMVTISAFVVGVGLVLISPLFGADFAGATTALLLLGPGMIARALGYSASQILLGTGQGLIVSRLMYATLVAGVLVWVPAIALFGIEGAAVGTSVAYLVQAGLTYRAATIRTGRAVRA